MSRRILTRNLQSATTKPQIDGYFDRVVKYIPADIIGAWVAVQGLINANSAENHTVLLWWCFAAGVLLTAAWTYRRTADAKLPPAYRQIAVSTLAFIAWIYALGGPFVNVDWWSPLYGSLLLILFGLSSGLIVPAE